MNSRFIYYLKLIRWPNLVMTILAIWLHWYFLIYLTSRAFQVTCTFGHGSIFLLGLAFAGVMGAGYVINDVFDQDIDRINKRAKQILNNHISVSSAMQFYWILNAIAFTISLYIALKFDQLRYLGLLPLAIGLLYIYSSRLKKIALIGNGLIALLCGAVLLLPFLFEQDLLNSIDPHLLVDIRSRFMICFTAAALLTLIREIVKDQEDIVGDRMNKANTLPIRLGEKRTDYIIMILLGACILFLLLMKRSIHLELFPSRIITAGIEIPLLVSLLLLFPFFGVKNYSRLSKTIKFIMVISMILLPIALKISSTWTG